ncbi:hypothetical protein L3X38_007725 [Prunus dulcis]|uniref:Uncharacterized protein n=1 Tax=Prunus dulcis TaxID=3755 RepID=A0AAD5F6F6_PRUDU|nr:hypothetical protein L3X38_007725 [Prunus dulcis]
MVTSVSFVNRWQLTIETGAHGSLDALSLHVDLCIWNLSKSIMHDETCMDNWIYVMPEGQLTDKSLKEISFGLSRDLKKSQDPPLSSKIK